jgi:translation initiation factor eIF-2B subunit alpha
LNQHDLPEDAKAESSFDYFPGKYTPKPDMKFDTQLCDFTPPELITMLITDTGILTPSAISDELIQMFNN